MSTELTVSKQTTPVAYIPSETDWNFMLNWGHAAVKSGMLPSAVKSPEAAAVIVLKGREMGISFMTAMAHIHIIGGKPTMSAELIQAMARKNLPGLVINILESDNKTAKIEFIRPEKGSKAYVQTFTIDDAAMAKLTSKDVWKQYPAAMLWSRAVTAGLRKVCPEALMGVSYTPEEMGANVDADGNVIEVSGRRMEGGSEYSPNKTQTSSQSSHHSHSNVSSIASKSPNVILLEQKLEQGQKIKSLRLELEMTEAELKSYILEMFHVEEPNKLSIEQLKQIVEMLEKLKANKPTPEWLSPENQAPIGVN